LCEGGHNGSIEKSTDNGKTWSRPWQLTTTAQVHAYLTELDDGRLLCTYSNYHVPLGVSATVSEDGGKTWDWDNTIRLSTSTDIYVGWAVTLQLPDGSLVTSYAATTYQSEKPDPANLEGFRRTCEVVRWRFPK